VIILNIQERSGIQVNANSRTNSKTARISCLSHLLTLVHEDSAMLDVSYMLLCALDVQERRSQSRENALRGLAVELVNNHPKHTP